MSENTKIEWATHTFNPWIGCTKVGPGCDHCYAENLMDTRLHAVQWGPGAPRKRTSAKNWADPIKWNAQHAEYFAQHGHRQRVFCSSLADVFDNEVPEPWRWDLFRLIDATPNLDWLLLTKRIGNAGDMLNESASSVMGEFVGARAWDMKPWSNVWLGATIVNQTEADRDIPKLLEVPAAKRFLSMEPLLGPVDLRSIDVSGDEEILPLGATWLGREEYGPRLDWVIVGGESGPGARPMHPDWARSLRDQCDASSVPFLFKQWGEWIDERHANLDQPVHFSIRRTTSKLMKDGSVLPLQQANASESYVGIYRVGKQAAGRLLDGIEHNSYPEDKASEPKKAVVGNAA